MTDWHAALKSIDRYITKKATKAAPKQQPPPQNNLSRHQRIQTLNSRNATQPAIANVSTLIYAVQVLLRVSIALHVTPILHSLTYTGRPDRFHLNPSPNARGVSNPLHLPGSPHPLRPREKDAERQEWTPAEVEQMAEATVMLGVYPPLVHGFVYHAAAVVCKSTICIQTNFLHLVDHWTTRGNIYSMQKDHPVSQLDRTSWILYLRGALGKLGITEVIPTLFDGPVVREILATPQTSHTRQALRKYRVASLTDPTHPRVFPEHPVPPPKFEEGENMYTMPTDSPTGEVEIPSPLFSFHSSISSDPTSSPQYPLTLEPWPSPTSTHASAVHPAPWADPTPPGPVTGNIYNNSNSKFEVPLDHPPAIQFRRDHRGRDVLRKS